MKWQVTTKQGAVYTVDDDSAWVWIRLERETGLTFNQARDKMAEGSMGTIATLLWVLSKDAGHTDLPNADDWARMQLDNFEIVEDADPKDSAASPGS